jgi:hypothetical protein
VSIIPNFINTILKFLARAVKHKKEIKSILIAKKEVKLSLLADDLLIYLKDCKDSAKFLVVINTSSEYKINIHKSVLFYITALNR